VQKLDLAAVRETTPGALEITEKMVERLNAIAQGKDVPRARRIVAAVSLKLKHLVPSPEVVELSSAAQALQEASETPAQTAKEARAGDAQAKRLLAREAAEKAAEKTETASDARVVA